MRHAEQKPDNFQKTDVGNGLLRLAGVIIVLDVAAFTAGISFIMMMQSAYLASDGPPQRRVSL